MNDLSLTVVIPTLEERKDFLEEALDSVKAQTIGGWKLIYAIDEHHSGPAFVRNEIIKQVDTDWILFLDDDDTLEPKYMENCVRYFDKFDMIYTWCHRVGFEYPLDIEFDAELLRTGNYIPVTACVRTEMFREVGGFNTDAIYEDWGLWLKLLDAGARFKPIYKKLWTYRRHEGSYTHINQHKVASGMSATGE